MDNSFYSILYVDDEIINIELFLTIFKRLYNVFTATSAIKGLQILESNKIDLIITDERMPGMSGVEFLKEVNKKYHAIPPHRIITSAYSEPDNIDVAFKNYKLNKFIPKPWKINELRDIVRKILEEK